MSALTEYCSLAQHIGCHLFFHTDAPFYMLPLMDQLYLCSRLCSVDTNIIRGIHGCGLLICVKDRKL